VSKIHPVVFTWRDVEIADSQGVVTGTKAMVPLARYVNAAARQYHEGEEYPLVMLETRSRASHNQYFAELNEGFLNLPENISARWPTAEHLRKWLLIETGWFNESEIDCASPKHAQQTAGLIRSFDEYARISVHGSKVIIRRAKSQSLNAMGKSDFEASKKDVRDLLESFIGIRPGSLKKEAGRAS
jgi:hypothetical protein